MTDIIINKDKEREQNELQLRNEFFDEMGLKFEDGKLYDTEKVNVEDHIRFTQYLRELPPVPGDVMRAVRNVPFEIEYAIKQGLRQFGMEPGLNCTYEEFEKAYVLEVEKNYSAFVVSRTEKPKAIIV